MKVVCFVLVAGGLMGAEYPEASISNSQIQVKLMVPDAERGSYRGTRFDWSGIISSLQYQGHEYFGQWYEKHDPKIHDAITGPVEEFRSEDGGLGYSQAKLGGTFVRIGVGTVRKPDENSYRLFATYDIVDPGKRAMRKGPDWIEFSHTLASDSGYAYVYRKTIRLTKGKPQLVIEHSLKNTGKQAIDTAQYNHNFFVIDKEVVGPDIAIDLAFTPKPDKPFSNGGEVRGQEITYTRELETRQTVAADLAGFGDTPKDYDVRIENRKAGAGVRITGDRPLSKFYFWSIRTVACPEPYIHLRVDPGQESKWNITYDFYTIAPKN